MLASKADDLSKLVFPVLASHKLDGIRAMITETGVYSRSLKLIPSRAIQLAFRGPALDGLDGELIYGDPTAKDCYRETVSHVMAEDKPIFGITYHAFDVTDIDSQPFSYRLKNVAQVINNYKDLFPIKLVEHELIENFEELEEFEAQALALGHEGIMIRSFNGRYKHGRASTKEATLLKVKRFVDSEAEILGFQELESNQNVSFKNELGRTARSSVKAGMVGEGTLGALLVRDLVTNVEFSVGTGFDAATRQTLWDNRSELSGAIIKYKFFAVGLKDKPRHPVYLGPRDSRDL